MIPVLYPADWVKNQPNPRSTLVFTTNGLGPLSDVISCVVTEERNGAFELEMEYPIDGIRYSDLAEDMIIVASTSREVYNDLTNRQAFRIYKISRPINGIVTIFAEHISYLLSKMVCSPFETNGPVNPNAALSDLFNHAIGYGGSNPFPFTTWSNKTTIAEFKVSEPKTIRNLLGGEEGSILDVYGGGEYKFDNFDVRLYSSRGQNNNVVIRYGKNLTDLKRDTDITNAYVGIVPYWKGSVTTTDPDTEESETTEVLVDLRNENPPYVVFNNNHINDYAYSIIKPVDFSSEYENPPEPAQLKQKAQTYLANNDGWSIKETLDVSFVNLADTLEYSDVGNLQEVKLCDTVTIKYEQLGVDCTAKVIKTVWNTLLESYESIELGESKTNLSNYISDEIADSSKSTYQKIKETKTDIETEVANAWEQFESDMNTAIADQANKINGAAGGYVMIRDTDNDGKPDEILIMEKANISDPTNKKMIRINKNGIGFSTNGYAPQNFDSAWTIDGTFSASHILTGTLDCSAITVANLTVGMITGILGDNTNYINFNASTPTISIGKVIVGSKNGINVRTEGAYFGPGGAAIGTYKGGANISRTSLVIPSASAKDYDSTFPDNDGAVIIGKAYFRRYPPWDRPYSSSNTEGYPSGASPYTHYGLYGDDQGRIFTPGSIHTHNMDPNTGEDAENYFRGYTTMGHAKVFHDLSISDNETRNGELYCYGDIQATGSCGGGWDPSDERLKNDITPISEKDAMSFIMAQEPVSFRWKKDVEKNKLKDPTEIHHGLVAQRVQKTNPNWNVVAGDDTWLGLRYEEIIADLIVVAKYQQKEIEELKKMIKMEGGES